MAVLGFKSVSKEYVTGSALAVRRRKARALADVSFEVGEGETVGLVGESGSGKSTIARLACGLVQPTAGEVTLFGNALAQRSRASRREALREVGFIFQDPYASLNPRHRIGDILSLPFRVHTPSSPAQIRTKVLELLGRVGLQPAERYAAVFPHQLSGGQRQRVAIARAIALRPRLLIADEPVASLDVSVAGQILNLLKSIQAELRSSVLFIGHDLGIVQTMSDRVLVLNGGHVVEEGPARSVLGQPTHPYTQLLLASLPERLRLDEIPTEEETAAAPAAVGCPFSGRCQYAMPVCAERMPSPVEVRSGHLARCWLLTEREQPPPRGEVSSVMPDSHGR